MSYFAKTRIWDGTDTLAIDSSGQALVSLVQNVTADANNSSTTNLTTSNSYTFTGTASSTLGVAGIQVSLYADKRCTVKVEQSPDATPHWDLIDTYQYAASSNFGVTVQAISSYVRVVVTTNNEATGTFRLQTALCPVVEAVPRSLDENGNFKIAAPQDEYGWHSEHTPMGEIRAIEPTRLVGTVFEGATIDANFWTAAASGTGAAVAQANAQLLLTSGTGNGDTVTAFTVRRARYVGGSCNRYRAVIQLGDTGTANSRRRWGVAWGSSAMPTVTDGAWFQLDGTTFSCVTMKGGSANTITAFNGHLGPTYTPTTNVFTCEIYWTNSKVYFVMSDDLLHTHSATTATWANTMTFHAFLDSVNSGTLGASTTIAARVATIYRMGKHLTQPQYYYFAAAQTTGVNLKLGAGNLHSMIINSATNNSVITLADSNTAATPAIFVHTAGASTTGVNSIDFKGLAFSNGLRLIVASANASLTLIYE